MIDLAPPPQHALNLLLLPVAEAVLAVAKFGLAPRQLLLHEISPETLPVPLLEFVAAQNFLTDILFSPLFSILIQFFCK